MTSKINIPILFESDDFLAVNKPAGLIVHHDGRTKEPALVDWIVEKYPELKDVGEPMGQDKEYGIKNMETEEDSDFIPDSTFKIPNSIAILRPGIVHRIDRDTSGVLLIAKNQHAFGYLKKQFQKRAIRKIYHAFVYGELKQDHGWIERPIGRSKNDFRRWTAERGVRGEMREARTFYAVLERKHGLTFVEVQPKTGRTHQIRVHFKAISHPVVCDKLYAPRRECLLGFGRTALHARSIAFTDLGGKKITVEAPYPEDFIEAIKQFKV